MAFNSSQDVLADLIKDGTVKKAGQESSEQKTTEQEKIEDKDKQEAPASEKKEESSSHTEEKEKPQAEEQKAEQESEKEGEKPYDDGFGQFVSSGEEEKEKEKGSEQEARKPTDEDYLKYLNEKYGKQFKSFDEIKFAEDKDPLSDISDPAKALDGYLKETGRTVIDWFNTQVIDNEKLDDRNAIIAGMVTKGYTQQDAFDKYNLDYELEQIPEDAEDNEKAIINRSNRLKELNMTAEAREARQVLKQNKEAFSSKLEGWEPVVQQVINETTQEQKESWTTQAEDFIANKKSYDIQITEDKTFRVSLDEYFSGTKDTYTNHDKFVNERLKDEKGNWRVQEIMEAFIAKDNLKKIVKSGVNNAFQMGQKEMSDTGKNLNFDNSNKTRGDHASESEATKKFNSQIEEALIKSGVRKGMSMKR